MTSLSETITARGIREMYVLVFLCLESREAIVSTSTEHPDSAWVVKQTETFLEQTKDRAEEPDIVMHDKDTKFTKDFMAKLKELGVRTNALPKTSPNLNGRCERFIQTIKLECLAKFIILGKQHLHYLLTDFTVYYNKVRSHMERDHLPPTGVIPDQVDTLPTDQILIRSHVGGLVKSFERKAA